MTDYASPADVLSAAEPRFADVELPSGRVVMIRSLSARQIRKLRESLVAENRRELDRFRSDRINYLICIHCWVDPSTKKPVCTEAEIDDFEQADGRDIDTLALACRQHIGWDAEYDFEQINGEVKNSEVMEDGAT